MKIEFRMDGGFAVFPGLARPFTIAVDDLPQAEASRLREAIASCRFFERPEPNAASGAAPDMRRYEITVDDGKRSRTLSIPESDGDPDLRSLIALLEEQRDSARRN